MLHAVLPARFKQSWVLFYIKEKKDLFMNFYPKPYTGNRRQKTEDLTNISVKTEDVTNTQHPRPKTEDRRPKLCLACSPGGHMLQMQQLSGLYKKYNHFFFTFERGMSKELSKKEKVVFVTDARRSPARLIKNIVQSFFVFVKERPDIVIANGGGFVVPFCCFAKIFRKKLVFIESFSRVEKPSWSGRLAHPLANLFIVQWKPLLKFYKKAVYGGPIF